MGKNQIIIYCVISILFFGCFENKEKPPKDQKMTIIRDSTYTKFMIGKNHSLWEPSNKDFVEINSIIEDAIQDGEFYFLKTKSISEIKKYYRQYLFYTDDKGLKIVFINSMCNISSYNDTDWRKEMLDIADGGDCYWSLKIDLTNKKLFSLKVNTEG
ncbi:hypothetical protein [Kordia sp.]|uniref:hypothetical protein n=1 Tax=Kordia sp. TaxID=1965332 RepID=UPI003D265E49